MVQDHIVLDHKSRPNFLKATRTTATSESTQNVFIINFFLIYIYLKFFIILRLRSIPASVSGEMNSKDIYGIIRRVKLDRVKSVKCFDLKREKQRYRDLKTK